MSLSIPKEQLFDVLQKTFPIIPLKSSLQILSNFRIIYDQSQLEIIATDLDQSIRAVLEAKGDNSFDITVNARKIFEIIRELPQGKVTISVEENVLILETEKDF